MDKRENVKNYFKNQSAKAKKVDHLYIARDGDDFVLILSTFGGSEKGRCEGAFRFTTQSAIELLRYLHFIFG